MVKNEQLRGTDQLKRVVPIAPAASFSQRPSMFQTTSITIPQRLIDPHAIDISSIKGRFAWEKIALGDTYMPVIFRGTTKYLCVQMLHKLLPEYPDDIIRHSSQYQYRKPIDLYVATTNEIELLNRINVHHAHWTYSRQPFPVNSELVRVSDFLPFYEHLRLICKSTPIPRTPSTGSLRPILPQPQQSIQRSPDFVVNTTNTSREHSAGPFATTSVPIQSYTASESPRENTSSVPRPIAPSLTALYPLRPPTYGAQPSTPSRQTAKHPPKLVQLQLPPPPVQQPIATSSSPRINSANIVLPNTAQTIPVLTPASQSSTSITSLLSISSSSPNAVISSPTATTNRKPVASSSEKQLTLTSKRTSSTSSTSSSSPAVPKIPRLNSGWLQINKLYTPYVSTSTTNHHLYKIPVSLLTFYDLLKLPSHENNTNEPKDLSFAFEQTSVTPQEIELINELCLKQNIKPFSIDTKLIDLLTFYQHCSSNIIFVKELPLNEPKASICKDWPSIVQINGGICRLRNVTTLHEQTVPFIGNNLLKNFIMSSQSLATATLTTPTLSEIEFLQLILFLSNMSINLRNSKLIDIESVQKEYNVDLILLFNDKFPLNVLNYQHQDKKSNHPSSSQGQATQSDSSAATNTFAESTPPPSPHSPPTNNITVNPSPQLPLTSPSSTTSNRYQKTITFHGHTMTAYICSGLGTNAQRECISVKALCNMLYPNSSIADKLETRMLRLLRLKNINRFRPQNQKSMGFTRLIDVKDIEKHWDYIEQGMRSLPTNDEATSLMQEDTSSLLDNNNMKASTLVEVEIKNKTVEEESRIEIEKVEKRPLERGFEEEDLPVLERISKRVRFSGEGNNEQSNSTKIQSTNMVKKYNHSDDDETEQEEDEDEESEDEEHNVDEDDDDSDSDSDRVPPKIRRISTPPVKIVLRQNDKKNKKKQVLRQKERVPSTSSRKKITPIRKKIKIVKKRSTPGIRTDKQSIAAWVQKYNIEECCIRLDLYDPIYETGRD